MGTEPSAKTSPQQCCGALKPLLRVTVALFSLFSNQQMMRMTFFSHSLMFSGYNATQTVAAIIILYRNICFRYFFYILKFKMRNIKLLF